MPNSSPQIKELSCPAGRAPAVERTDDRALEALYARAYAHYQQCDYSAAASKFGYLTLRRPTNAKFLKGLAASQFMACNYKAAVTTYSFLLVLFPNDPEAQCMCGHALLMTGQRMRARKLLARGLALSAGAPEFNARARSLFELSEH